MKAEPCFLAILFLIAACSAAGPSELPIEGEIPFETILQNGDFFETDPDGDELRNVDGPLYDRSALFPAPKHVVLRSEAEQRRFLSEYPRRGYRRSGEDQERYPKFPEVNYSEDMVSEDMVSEDMVIGVVLGRRAAPITVSTDSLKAQDGRIVAYATEHYSAFMEGTENPVHFVKTAQRNEPVALAPVDSVEKPLFDE